MNTYLCRKAKSLQMQYTLTEFNQRNVKDLKDHQMCALAHTPRFQIATRQPCTKSQLLRNIGLMGKFKFNARVYICTHTNTQQGSRKIDTLAYTTFFTKYQMFEERQKRSHSYRTFFKPFETVSFSLHIWVSVMSNTWISNEISTCLYFLHRNKHTKALSEYTTT